MDRSVRHTVTIQRHSSRLPRFVVVPAARVAPWGLRKTTVVEGTINGHLLGRRSLKRWDDERWFIDLPERLCRAAGIDTGDSVTLECRPASERLPAELSHLLATNPAARARWNNLTESRQRVLREHVAAAKAPPTRERRARRALCF